MPKLVLHIGLHKTGTTSIQYSCNKNRHVLYGNSIAYPESSVLTLGTRMHLGLTATHACIEELIRTCSALEYDFVFMSNENLCGTLANMSDFAFGKFIDGIYSSFDDVVWVISVRNDFNLLTSAAREFLDGSAFPMAGIDEFLYSYLKGIEVMSARIKTRKIKVVDIDADMGGMNWPTYFLSKVFGMPIEIENSHQNSSKNKTIASLFNSVFRSFYSNVLGSHYYSTSVSEATERAITAVHIDKGFESEFNSCLNEYIDIKVRNVIGKPTYVSVKHMFENAV